MMQSAHFRERDDATLRRRLNASWRRSVLLQGEMCSRPMIIGKIRGQQTSQMALAEDDDVVQTLALMDPINLSAYGFCHGLDGAEITSPMSMLATRRRNTSP
jgi:hypothetical protein